MKPPAVKATGKGRIYVCLYITEFMNVQHKEEYFFFFASSVEGLSLLGAYEDSDDEEAGNSRAPATKLNQSSDIDSTLANFMAVSISCKIF